MTKAELVCVRLRHHLETHYWNDKILMKEILPLANEVVDEFENEVVKQRSAIDNRKFDLIASDL